MLSRLLGGTGRTLITAGTLILLFVAYQLWGTGLQEAASQRKLDDQFAELQTDVRQAGPTTSTVVATTTLPGAPTTTRVQVDPVSAAAPSLVLPRTGDAVAKIEIPKIGVTRTVVEGVSVGELKRGPGHYPETPLPGQAGNASIAGHRTTYGQPFHNVDKLENGDQIEVTTVQGSFVYEVDRITIVKPSESGVLLPTKDAADVLENRITLTACHPKYSARQRIIISGLLKGKPKPELPGQAKAREKAAIGRGTNSATLDATVSGRAQSKTPAITWGLICAAVWFATWLVQLGLRKLVRRRTARREVDVETADGLAPEPQGFAVRAGTAGPAASRPRARAHRRPLSGPWRTGPYPSRAQRALTWSPYLVGLPIFLVTLYVFFENFALLLPANF